MPNHVTNIVSINMKYADEQQGDYDKQSAKLNSLYAKLKTSESDFDFNTIVPSPHNKESGNCSGEHKDGEVCWYGWNNEHWGTKWNAYEVKYLNPSYDDDTTVFEILVKFETAWSPPLPVLRALANDFLVEYTWRNEGDDVWHDWEKVEAQ